MTKIEWDNLQPGDTIDFEDYDGEGPYEIDGLLTQEDIDQRKLRVGLDALHTIAWKFLPQNPEQQYLDWDTAYESYRIVSQVEHIQVVEIMSGDRLSFIND